MASEELNMFQEALLREYENGQFFYITTAAQAAQCGDTLFAFLFVELSDAEGCDSQQEADNRMDTVLRQVSHVAAGISSLGDEVEVPGELVWTGK